MRPYFVAGVLVVASRQTSVWTLLSVPWNPLVRRMHQGVRNLWTGSDCARGSDRGRAGRSGWDRNRGVGVSRRAVGRWC